MNKVLGVKWSGWQETQGFLGKKKNFCLLLYCCCKKETPGEFLLWVKLVFGWLNYREKWSSYGVEISYGETIW